MAWEPWLQATEPQILEEEWDPDDPRLLVNILTDDAAKEPTIPPWVEYLDSPERT